MKRAYVPRAAVFVMMTVFLVTGCAGLGKRLESPKISLVHLEIVEAKLFETVFQMELRVFNTNEVALVAKGLDCTLEVNGKEWAQGVSDATVEIPAQGTATVPLTVYSSLANMVQGVLGLQETEKLHYRIKGRLRLKGGYLVPSVVPFDSKGEIPFSQ